MGPALAEVPIFRRGTDRHYGRTTLSSAVVVKTRDMIIWVGEETEESGIHVVGQGTEDRSLVIQTLRTSRSELSVLWGYEGPPKDI